MKGLCLDSGEFIPADELNAKWIPRKATEEEMSNVQTESLRLADVLEKLPGYDWNKTYCESAAELRRLAAVEKELEALKRAISEEEPVAWCPALTYPGYEKERVWCSGQPRQEDIDYWQKHGEGVNLAYTLKGIK